MAKLQHLRTEEYRGCDGCGYADFMYWVPDVGASWCMDCVEKFSDEESEDGSGELARRAGDFLVSLYAGKAAVA